MIPSLGKILIILGVLLVVVGLVMVFADRIPWLGKLPGDITIKRESFTLHIPIVTMLLISIVLTILLNIFGRGK
ncbi:DUF2905 family protein [candidate division GN15 bacterium]|nr:DUF2905 family protein [candidate division GN15 bacterium]